MPSLLLAGVVASSLLATAYVALGAIHDRLATRRASRREAARRAIVDLLAMPADDARWQRLPALTSLRRREQAALLSPLAADLDGEALARVRGIAVASGLDRLVTRLARSRRASVRLRAAQLIHLLQAGSGTIATLLADSDDLVRARTADGLAAGEARAHAQLLGERLADPSAGVAFAAQQALLRAGEGALGAVRVALDRSDGGVRLALELATNLPDPRLATRLGELAESPDAAVRAQAARAVAAVDPVASAGVIASLLSDANEIVRAAAAEAAGDARLAGLASPLGRLLGDESWAVRYQAGEALAALGAPGLLVLRRALEADDRFARDIARQMLDIVEGREQLGWRAARQRAVGGSG